MKWKSYQLELVTRAFISGADQRRAELRIPSIRGQLRWWFRALGASRESEARLFGAVHGSVQRSCVRLRLEQPVSSNQAVNLEDLFGKNSNHPQAYLLWPLRPSRTGDQRRGVLEPGTGFTLQAALESKRLADAALESTFWDLLEVWKRLGALGTRSRRGYGSVGAAGEQSGALSRDEWVRALDSGLRSFPRASITVLALGDLQPSPESALDKLGDWLKQFRAGSRKSVNNPDRWGRNDHDVALGKQPGPLYRPVIGLPLTQRYGRRIVVTSFKRTQRWASPVHLRVTRWGSRFQPIALFFPEMALPEGAKVTLSEGEKPWNVPVSRNLFQEMMKPQGASEILWEPKASG